MSDQNERETMMHCDEHSGQRALLKTLLGLMGLAVTILLFQVGLTLKMNDNLKSDLAKLSDNLKSDVSAIRERVAVLEFQVGHRDK